MEATEPQTARPRRHGCLTTFLVVIVLANTLIALLYLWGGDDIVAGPPPPWPGAIQLLALIGTCNVVFAIALFRWKKWGFYGFAVTSLVTLGINLSIGVGVANSLFGLAGVAILYWTLQMGDGNRAWPRLE